MGDTEDAKDPAKASTARDYFDRMVRRYREPDGIKADKVLHIDRESGVSVTVGEVRGAKAHSYEIFEPEDQADEFEAQLPDIPSPTGKHHMLPFTLARDVYIDTCDVGSQARDWYERDLPGMKFDAKTVRYLTEFGFPETDETKAIPFWPLICERGADGGFAVVRDASGSPIDVDTLATWDAYGRAMADAHPELAFTILASSYLHLEDLQLGQERELGEGAGGRRGPAQGPIDSDWRQAATAMTPVMNHILGVSLASREMPRLKTDGSITALNSGGAHERDVNTLIALRYDAPGISTSATLSTFDKLVSDAVTSLMAAGNWSFTARQVCRAMGYKKPRKEGVDEVEASIDRLSRIRVEMDFSSELRGRTVEIDGETITPDDCRLTTQMLNLESATITGTNGKRYRLFHLLREPIFYYHDKIVRQVTTYPQRYFELIGEKVRMDTDVMAITQYLVQEIRFMGRPNSHRSTHIKYATVFQECGIKIGSREKKRRETEKVRGVLDALAQGGEIDGWDELSPTGTSHEKVGVNIRLKAKGNIKSGRKKGR